MLFPEGHPIEVELPNSVVLQITETDPGVKATLLPGVLSQRSSRPVPGDGAPVPVNR